VSASLDGPVGSDATALGELVADRDGPDPAESAIAREQTDQLREMLDRLPERHRLLLVWRYGLGGQRVRSHAEIGSLLGVGEERSRQIEREALRRLRSIASAFRLAA
jgi:RNA polymerase primary sigma factor